MKMYDMEVCLDGGDIWIAQNDNAGQTVVISVHPDQVDLLCDWLKDAAKAIKCSDAKETQR